MMRVRTLVLPDLSPLPLWLQVLLYLTFAAACGVIWFLVRMGIIKGRDASPDKPGQTAQIAAVIVDSTALNRASDILAILAQKVADLTAALDRHLIDQREQREEQELDDAYQRGRNDAVREKEGRPVPPRSRPPRKP